MKDQEKPSGEYKTIQVKKSPDPKAASVMLIYTGGTLGMVFEESAQTLVPFDFEQILSQIPEIDKFNLNLTVISFHQLIDSANVQPSHWITMASLIEQHYDGYNGFVIIHGTDTMAYSASALSYLLEDLNKPVIFTGAQLPIGAVRTDARENLITALEIASARRDGRPIVPEVCVFFSNKLLRGNRAKKIESAQFRAFESKNYPSLATCGIRIDYNFNVIKPYQPYSKLKVYKKMDSHVTILKLFPGINYVTVKAILEIPGLRGVVLETYGSGNAETSDWFIGLLKNAIDSGMLIYNVSQCNGGTVTQGRYETSRHLQDIGVLSGADSTTEAAITKLMFLLANQEFPADARRYLVRAIRGEMS
ncbi:MAG TPA: asparaginase [Catalimonadaceae bacterium]|nr:asparaginase [Catalimonadaceae bacterium]HPI09492.1 asparaginase [Catalimonadaceae bacterium]